MSNNSTIDCLYQGRAIEPNTLPYYIGNYVFPVVFTAGLVGNILNLIILNRVKNAKSVHFLSVIALADLCFFLAMFVLNLTAYESLAINRTFLKFYYNSKMIFLTLANWFSSISIWLLVIVTVERLIAIRTPLKARTMWHSRNTLFISLAICFLTMILQLPHFLWLTPSTKPDCTNRERRAYGLVQMHRNHAFYEVVKYANLVCPVIVVTIPLILLISLNSLLVYYVKNSRMNVKKSGGALNYGQNHSNSNSNIHICSTVTENETKITYTVSVVVFTFFVFNFPSAVIWIYSVIEKDVTKFNNLITPMWIANYLVTLNKALTFPLYCCSSSNFREHLAALVGTVVKLVRQKWRRLSVTEATTSGTIGVTLLSNCHGGSSPAPIFTSRHCSNESNGTVLSTTDASNKKISCSSESSEKTSLLIKENGIDCLPLL